MIDNLKIVNAACYNGVQKGFEPFKINKQYYASTYLALSRMKKIWVDKSVIQVKSATRSK